MDGAPSATHELQDETVQPVVRTCDGPVKHELDGSTAAGDDDVEVIHAGEGLYVYGSDVQRMGRLNVGQLCSDDEFFQLEGQSWGFTGTARKGT